MCIPLLNPNAKTETIVKKPSDLQLPVPPAQPDPRHLGDGAAAKAGRELRDRKKKLDLQIEAATQ